MEFRDYWRFFIKTIRIPEKMVYIMDHVRGSPSTGFASAPKER